jgi:hypothetical protein
MDIPENSRDGLTEVPQLQAIVEKLTSLVFRQHRDVQELGENGRFLTRTSAATVSSR